MKKLGLFTGGLILLFALQLSAELIPLTVVNGDFENPVVVPSSGETERALVDQSYVLPGWTISSYTNSVFHCQASNDSDASSQFLEINNDNARRVYTDVLQTVANPTDYVVAEGDIITVKFNQSGKSRDGAGVDRKVAVYLLSGDASSEVQAANNVGFSGKSFLEGVVTYHVVASGSPLIGENLRVGFSSVSSDARIDNVRVEVERPTISDNTIPSLPKAVKLAADDDRISVDYNNDFSDFEGIDDNGLNSVTFEAWIKRPASLVDKTAIIFSRDVDAQTCGLNIMANGQLRYNWKTRDIIGYNPQITIPADKWAYVALSVSSKRVDFYAYTAESGWMTAGKARDHDKAILKALAVGYDSRAANRTFKGDVAEVRVWDEALTEQQLKYNMSKVDPNIFGIKPLIHYNFNELTTAASGTVVNNLASSKYPASITSTSATLTDFVQRRNSVTFTGGGAKHIKVGNWGLADANNLNSALTGADKDKVSILQGGDWTAEFYIKRYSEPTSISNTHLTYRYNGSTGLRLSTFNNTRRVGYASNADTVFNDAYAPMNEWAHYVYVRKGNEIELFINGVSYGVTNNGRDITFRSIGAEVENSPEMELRAVRMWSRALGSSEITGLGLNGGELSLTELEGNDDLVLYYDFNQLPGGKVVDLSSNKLDGTLTNFGNAAATEAAFLPTVVAAEQSVTVTADSVTEATVEWTAIPGVYEYYVEYDTSQDFASPTVVKVENATSVTLSLTPTVGYFVRVKSRLSRTQGRIDYYDSYFSSSEFVQMPINGPHVVVSGQLDDEDYGLVAGKEKNFRMTLRTVNDQNVSIDDLTKTGVATVTLSEIVVDGNGNYGSVNGSVISSLPFSFNVTFNQGKMASGDQVSFALNNVVNTNVKIEVDIPWDDDDNPSTPDVIQHYESSTAADNFIGWDEFKVTPNSADELELNVAPLGVPNTVNGGVVTTQPRLTAKDAYGNVAVGDYTCVAELTSGVGHIGGAAISSNDGNFQYENFAVINGGESLISGNLDVLFEIEGTSADVSSTITSATVRPSIDAPGKSYVFDGTGYINAGNVESLNRTSSFTLSAWFKVDEFVANSAIIQRYEDDSNWFFLGFGANSGDLKFSLKQDGTDLEQTISNQYELNEWVHIALEFDSLASSNQVKLYINGSPLTYNYNLNTPLDLGNSDVLIGKNGDALFKGELDEVKIWSSTVNVQTKAIYADEGDEAGLLLYYKFDSGVNSLFDLSKEGNHGVTKDWAGVAEATSYAMGCPVTLPASDVEGTEFKANWDASKVVNPSTFDIEISETEDFSSIIPNAGVNGINGTLRTTTIDGEELNGGSYYYYRTIANFNGGEERYSTPVAVLTQPDNFEAPGNAVVLNNTKYISAFDTTTYNEDWTVQTWLKPTSVSGTKKVLVTGANGSILADTGSGLVGLEINSTIHEFPNSQLQINQWSNLSFVYDKDAEQVTLYINGYMTSRVSVAFQLEFEKISSLSNPFVGELDEFVVWSDSLERAGVRNTMFIEKSLAMKSPSIYYSFDLVDPQTVLLNAGMDGGGVTIVGGPGSYVASAAWDIPFAYPASNVTTSSFTANWRAATGRNGVTVFTSSTLNSSGELENPETQNVSSGNAFTFGSLASGITKYYQVSYPGTPNVRSSIIQTFTATPAPGNCMQFGRNGSTFVQLDEVDGLRGSNFSNFTLEAWVMSTGSSSSSYAGIIGSNASIDAESAPVIALTGTGNKKVQYGFGNDWGATFFATTDDIIEPYVWTHLAVCYDGSSMKLYKDGAVVDEMTNVNLPPNPESYISFIGKRSGGRFTRSSGDGDGFFSGLIDEVRIWNVARTRKQIADNYNLEVAPESNGLAAYYRFNKSGNAIDVSDLTGNGANGEYSEPTIDPLVYTPWINSYALISPTIKGATDITVDSFTANWEKPSFGQDPTAYLLYVSENPSFNSNLPGYGPKKIDAENLSETVSISGIDKVYYKVSAINDAVTLASGYASDVASLSSESSYVITNKVPAPGNALKFDGIDDYITIDQSGGLQVGSNDFSVEFWVKNDYIADQQYDFRAIIVNKVAENRNGSGWGIHMNARGQIAVNTRKGDGEQNAFSKSIADGNWHHVAVVFNRADNVTVTYIDGQLDNSTAFLNDSTDVLSNDSLITIGADTRLTNGRNFTGWLDDLRIWKKALTADEIFANMNNELFYAELPDELELYYQFDEEGSAPTSIADLTDNSHIGVMKNFTDNDLDIVWQTSAAMGAPNNVEITQIETGSFKVSWTAPENVDVDSYRIEISTDNFENVTVAQGASVLVPAVTNYTVTGLTPATPYFVRVIANSSLYAEGRRASDVVVKSTLAESLPGAALSFDGVDDYVTASPKAYQFTKNLSFSAWIKLDSGTLAGMAQRAVLFNTLTIPAEQNSHVTVYLEPNGKLSYRWDTSNLKISGNTVRITEGEWNHISVCFGLNQGPSSDKEGGFYITPVSTGTTLSSFADHNTGLECNLYGTSYIGGISANSSLRDSAGFFKGTLDDVQIITQTLQPADIAILSNNYVDANNSIGDQLLYLPFNEGSGDTIGDLSNERFAEIKGATWTTADYLTDRLFVKPAKKLTEDGFTLQWESVSGATSYDIKVYDLDGNLVFSTSTTEHEIIIDSLTNYGQYEYEVTAQPSGNSSGKEKVTTGAESSNGSFTPGYAVRMDKGESLRGSGPIFGSAPEEFTVEFWCKPEIFEDFNLLINSVNPADESNWKGFTFHTDKFVRLYTGTTSTNDSERILVDDGFEYIGSLEDQIDSGGTTVAKKPTTAVWQHFAITFNRGTMKVYRNGRLLVSKNGIADSAPWNGLEVANYGGVIDELRVWSKELSENEISDKMLSIVSPDSDYLRAYYRFDQRNLDHGVPDLAGNASLLDISNPKPEVRASYSMVKPVATDAKVSTSYTGFVLSWDEVNGSTSYDVKVFLDEGLTTEITTELTIDVNGEQAQVSLPEKYSDVKTYYYQVIAQPSGSTAAQGNVSADAGSSLEFEFNWSEVQPLGRELDSASVFDGYKTTYRIEMATSQDFINDSVVNEVISFVPPAPPAPGENPKYIVEGDNGIYKVTLNDLSIDFEQDGTYYIRVSATDEVRVNLNESNDSTVLKSFSLGTSTGSNEVLQVFPREAPGNALYFPDNYPVSGKVGDYPVSTLQSSAFTVELWIQIEDGVNDMPVLATKNLGQPQSSGWALTTDEGEPVFELSNNAETVSLSAGSSIADGQWHHLALSVDRDLSSATFYLDGNSVKTISNVPAGDIGDSDILAFGQDTTGLFSGQFKGAIDEVRIWSSARSEFEITSNMIDSVSVESSDLISYYNCDLDGGDVLVDVVSQKNAVLSGELFRSWIKSYAQGCPQVEAPTAVSTASFVANWDAAKVKDDVVKYSLEVSNNPQFISDGNRRAAGSVYNDLGFSFKVTNVPTATEADDTSDPVNLFSGGSYFYRVIADYGSDGTPEGRITRTSKTYATSTDVDYDFAPKHCLDIIPGINEHCVVPSKPEFESPEVTVTAWFRPNLPDFGESGYGTLVSNRDVTGTRYSLHVANNLTEIQIWNGSENQIRSINLEANKWYHVAAVMTSSNTKMYINGEEVSLTVNNGIPAPSRKPLYIGSAEGSDGFFDGRIDEVTLWDHALSRTEIIDNLNFELTGNESGLVGYYKFDNDDEVEDDPQLLYIPDMSQTASDAELENLKIDEHVPWTSSAALGCPQVLDPVNRTKTSMDARWEKALTVNPEVDKYLLNFSSNANFLFFNTESFTQFSSPENNGSYQVPVTKITASAEERNGLKPGTNYYYRVFADIAPGVRRYSEIITASTLFKAPGNAIYFGDADNQFIDLGPRSELEAANLSTFTIEAWVKPRRFSSGSQLDTDTNNGIGGIIGGNFNDNNNPTVPTLAVQATDDLLWGFVSELNQNGVRVVEDVFGEVRWYHIAFTFDGQIMNLYVDGNLTDTFTLNSSRPNSNQIRFIGKYSNAGGFYDGEMDEVRIWRNAKTITEIRSNIYRPIPQEEYDVSGNDLIAYFQFDQSEGLLTNDSVSPNDTARLQGFGDLTPRSYWIQNTPDLVGRTSAAYNNERMYSLVENYNVGLIELAGRTEPVSGGMRVDNVRDLVAVPNTNPVSFVRNEHTFDTDEFISYSQTLSTSNLDRFKTMSWGLAAPGVRSTQVSEQSWYLRSEGLSDDITIDLTFNLREISPEIYDYENYTGEKLTNYTDEEKDAIIARFGETVEYDYQLLWSSVEIVSDNLIYRDVTPYNGEFDAEDPNSDKNVQRNYTNITMGKNLYSCIVLDLDANDQPVPGTETALLLDFINEPTAGQNITLLDGTEYYLSSFVNRFDKDDDEYYDIVFRNVPLRRVQSGTLYEGNYYGLGMSTALNDFVLTPAVGLESKVTLTEDGAKINWTVEDELGVTRYLVQKRNADGTWTTIEVIMVNSTGEYFIIDPNYKEGDEYRIVTVDKFGTEQAFAVGKNENTYFVTLDAGWNLISLPCTNLDASDLEAHISGGFWKWENNAYKRVDSCPESLEGFWVHNPGDKVIVEVSGKPVTDGTVNLETGWNIYGPVENCDVPPAVEIVYGWSSAKYDQVIKDYNIMMVTRGYWMFSLIDETVKLQVEQK